MYNSFLQSLRVLGLGQTEIPKRGIADSDSVYNVPGLSPVIKTEAINGGVFLFRLFFILFLIGCTTPAQVPLVKSSEARDPLVQASIKEEPKRPVVKIADKNQTIQKKMAHKECIICHINPEGKFQPFIRTKIDRVNPHTKTPFTRIEAICTSCHDFFHYVHPEKLKAKSDRVVLPKNIRLENGRLSCLSCHNLHAEEPSYKGLNQPVKSENQIKDFCLNCHVRADQLKDDVYYMLSELKLLSQQKRKVIFLDNIKEGWLFKGPASIKRFYDSMKGVKYSEEVLVEESFRIKKYASMALRAIKKDDLNRAIHLLWTVFRQKRDYTEGYTRMGMGFENIGRDDLAEMIYLHALGVDNNYAPAHFRLGSILARKEKYREAVSRYDNAIHNDPKMSEAYLEMGNCYLILKDYKHGINAFKKVLNLEPKNLEAFQKLARIYRLNGNYISAIRVLNNALVFYPEHFEIHFELGKAHYARSNISRAITSYKKALESRPGDFQTYIQMGKAFEMLQETDQALRNYEDGIRANRYRIEGYLHLARLYLKLKLYGKAREAGRIAVQIRPDSLDAHLVLGDAYYQYQEYSQAEREYQAILSRDPVHTDANIHLGLLYRKSGRIDDAIAVFQKMVAWKSNRAEVYLLLGRCIKNNPEDALRIYQKGLSKCRDKAVFYFNIGHLYWKELHRPELARQAYEKAIDAFPEYDKAYLCLGHLAKEKNDIPQAVGFLEKAVEFNPNRIDAYMLLAELSDEIQPERVLHKILNLDPVDLKDFSRAPFALYELEDNIQREKFYSKLGTIYMTYSKWERAVEMFRRILDKNPVHSEALSNFVISYRAQDKLEVALEKLTELLKLYPEAPEIHVELGNIHKYMGKKRLAYKNYSRAQKLAPDQDIALMSLKDVDGDFTEEVIASKEELLAQGEAHYKDQEYFRAERKYQAILVTEPLDPEANIRLVRLYSNSNRNKKLIATLEKMVKGKSDQAEFYLLLGERGNVDDALGIYREGLKYCSDKAVLYFNLAYLYWKELHQLKQAREAFETAISSYPEYDKAYFYLGCILSEENDIPQAVRYMEKAIKINPDRIDAYLQLAELGKNEYYQKLLLKAPNPDSVEFNKISRVPNAQYEIDIKDIQQKEEFYHKLGTIYMGNGQWENAIESFSRVLKWNSSNTVVMAKIGIAYKALNRFQDALRMLYKLLKILPGEPEFFYEIGNIYKEMGQKELVMESYLKAQALAHGNVKVINKLNLALAELYYDIWREKKEKAFLTQAEHFHEKVLETHPEYQKYRLRLEKIRKLLNGQIQILMVSSEWQRKYQDIVREIRQDSSIKDLIRIVRKYPKNCKIIFLYPNTLGGDLQSVVNELKDGEISPVTMRGKEYVGIYRIASSDGGKK